MAHVTHNRFALGWLSVAWRQEYFIGNLAFKIWWIDAPIYLSDKFVPTHTQPQICRSDGSYLLLPQARTEAYRKSFTLRAINSLGGRDLCTVSIDLFKTGLLVWSWSKGVGLTCSKWGPGLLLSSPAPWYYLSLSLSLPFSFSIHDFALTSDFRHFFCNLNSERMPNETEYPLVF